MIALAGSIRIGAGKREEALPHFRRVIEATRAEPGCVQYAFAFDLLDDHLIRIFEIYTDQVALDSHRASVHFRAWRAANPDLEVTERILSEYEVGAPRKI